MTRGARRTRLSAPFGTRQNVHGADHPTAACTERRTATAPARSRETLPPMTTEIRLVERGETLVFTPQDALRFHGPGSPGGVAIGFHVLALATRVLEEHAGAPCERRRLRIRTAFVGPGARDAFEMITRAVSDDRFVLDPSLIRPALGRMRERMVFVVEHDGDAVTLVLRADVLDEEFIDLVAVQERTPEQEHRLDVLKRALADRVLARDAADALDVVG